jgi:hypothetical protein
MDDPTKRTIREPTPPRWKGAQSLGPVHQFNERCLELLVDIAVSGDPEATLPLITEHRGLWISLDVVGRQRLAKMPFMLAEANFDDEVRWRDVIAPTMTQDEPRVVGNGLPTQLAENLMHELMMFAWQTACWGRSVASMCFGMSPPVISIIAALTPHQIRAAASREGASVRIRWADDLLFWEDLLVAAQIGDEKTLATLHLHGKLMLCGHVNGHAMNVGQPA